MKNSVQPQHGQASAILAAIYTPPAPTARSAFPSRVRWQLKPPRSSAFSNVFETMLHLFVTAVVVIATCGAVPLSHHLTYQQQPSFPLNNAAAAGLVYPAVGLGTGGYGLDPLRKYPQCWIEAIPGCGAHASAAVSAWLKMGGWRIDSADSYGNQKAIGKGIKESGVPREQVFITSKIGPSQALGYNDTLSQIKSIKAQLGVEYVDMLLVHCDLPFPQ